MKTKDELIVLREFLKYPLNSTKQIIDRFCELDGAVHRNRNVLEEFVYIRGKRKNKVLLVAHADTVWDSEYTYVNEVIEPDLIEDKNIIKSKLPNYGIGADDRAGCSMLWLFRNSGHSLIVTNGEENGVKGSFWLINDPDNADIREEIQSHQFIIQLDRRNGKDFKCYSVGNDEFRQYFLEITGYNEPDRTAATDIVILCRDIMGVNLSIGYRNEHKVAEELHIDEWQNTLSVVRRWLDEADLPRFELKNRKQRWNLYKIESNIN